MRQPNMSIANLPTLFVKNSLEVFSESPLRVFGVAGNDSASKHQIAADAVFEEK